jgi:hypothetical protein
MNIWVRDADLEQDRHILIDSHYRYLSIPADATRFDWLYTQNPYGPARAWVVTDETTGAVVGTAAAFPRQIQVGGEELRGWVLGDFCIRSDFRSLGPALLLQRACLAPVQAGEVPFCYDYPSSRMMAIYRRLGVSPIGMEVRFAKPLRVNRKVAEVLGEGGLTRALNASGNAFLAFQDSRRQAAKGHTVAMHEGCFGEEFTALYESVARHYTVCVQRTATYLNWRYLNNPLRRYEVVTVRRAGDLLAYAIFTQSDQDAMLVDLFGAEDATVMEGLLVTVIAMLRQRQVISLTAPLLNTHPLIPLLKRFGFFPREHAPVVVYMPPHRRFEGVVDQGKNWFLTRGDRDV